MTKVFTPLERNAKNPVDILGKVTEVEVDPRVNIKLLIKVTADMAIKVRTVRKEEESKADTIDPEVMLRLLKENTMTKELETFKEVAQGVSPLLAQNLHFRIGDDFSQAQRVEALDV